MTKVEEREKETSDGGRQVRQTDTLPRSQKSATGQAQARHREWNERNPNTPIWRSCQKIGQSTKKIRHDTHRGNSTKSSTKQKGLTRTCTEPPSSNALRPKNQTNPSPDQSESRRTGCTLSTVVLMGERCLSPQGQQPSDRPKNNLKIQVANSIVRSMKEARIYIQQLGTHLYMKLVPIRLWCCRLDDCPMRCS